MRTAMRPRYYCDHCNKGNGSPSAMKRHESGCTNNPHRVCRMCAVGEVEQVTPYDLVKLLDLEGFKAMCGAANQCPACILATLRRRFVQGEFGEPLVSGPDDGRNEWSYAQAKTLWWDSFNSDRADIF